MAVKLGLAHYEKNITWGFLSTGCWVEYLTPSGRKAEMQHTKLYNLYSSPINRMMKYATRWITHVAQIDEMIYIHAKFWSENLEEKIWLERCRWQNNKMDLKEIVSVCGLDWSRSVDRKVGGHYRTFRFHKMQNFLTHWVITSFWKLSSHIQNKYEYNITAESSCHKVNFWAQFFTPQPGFVAQAITAALIKDPTFSFCQW